MMDFEFSEVVDGDALDRLVADTERKYPGVIRGGVSRAQRAAILIRKNVVYKISANDFEINGFACDAKHKFCACKDVISVAGFGRSCPHILAAGFWDALIAEHNTISAWMRNIAANAKGFAVLHMERDYKSSATNNREVATLVGVQAAGIKGKRNNYGVIALGLGERSVVTPASFKAALKAVGWGLSALPLKQTQGRLYTYMVKPGDGIAITDETFYRHGTTEVSLARWREKIDMVGALAVDPDLTDHLITIPVERWQDRYIRQIRTMMADGEKMSALMNSLPIGIRAAVAKAIEERLGDGEPVLLPNDLPKVEESA